MLQRERMFASIIAAKIREDVPTIDIEVNNYPDKMIIMFRTSKDGIFKQTELSPLSLYDTEEDIIADAVILVRRGLPKQF